MMAKSFIFIALFLGILHLSVNCSQAQQSPERIQAFMMLAKEFEDRPTSDIYAVTKLIQNAKQDVKAEAEYHAWLSLLPPHEQKNAAIICWRKSLPYELRY